MKKGVFILFIFCCVGINTFSQTNMMDFIGVGERIKSSMREHDRQKEGLEKQTANTALETANKKELSKYKQKVKQIESRVDKVSIVFDALKIVSEGNMIVNKIKEQQSQVVNIVIEHPKFALTVIPMLIEMGNEMELLIRYLTGVGLSYADVGGMDNADRKVITNFILSELNSILIKSSSIHTVVRNLNMRENLKYYAFREWINKDRRIVNEIIENAKRL